MNISDFAIPVLVGFVLLFGLVKKCEVYPAFTSGAEDGLKTAVKIIEIAPSARIEQPNSVFTIIVNAPTIASVMPMKMLIK